MGSRERAGSLNPKSNQEAKMKIITCAVWLAAAALSFNVAPAIAKDIPGSKDHPLLKRFEGS